MAEKQMGEREKDFPLSDFGQVSGELERWSAAEGNVRQMDGRLRRGEMP